MTPAARDASPLDNPAWAALRGRHAGFALSHGDGRLLCFDPEVSVFSAVDRLDESSWADLAAASGAGGSAVLLRDHVPAAPAGWSELYRDEIHQMVAGDVAAPPDLDCEPLGAESADEMLQLAQLTEPGPFCPRTFELGGYIGVRREGRLVAMAGHRLAVPGWTEISAVCVHPDARKQGLAAALTLRVAAGIRARGDEAFLHVLTSNENALRLYERLGFTIRRRMDVVMVQWNG